MALAATYEVSLLALVWRRLYGKPLPAAPWSLGRCGLPLNCAGMVYGAYLFVYSSMPTVYPVTAADFNWAPVMFGGVTGLGLVYFVVRGKQMYRGPVVHVMQD